ncbi:MAG: cyclic pyranopterin monophosphate synthase MoaC [Polyangiaceae bacterium]
MKKKLTHLDARGHARMVDVSEKEISHRVACARATLRMKKSTRALLFADKTKKGDAFAIAKIAGISAAKRTSELIPLCHGIALTRVAVEIEKGEGAGDVVVRATAEARDRTGVEMEALTAASIAALTIYDMVKSVDRGVSFEIVLEEKRGGKSGAWKR